ncbi:hypothetical protein Pla108_23470 [Botrimarina colliarenosi]|uniref:DUF403 domain-containing protein n=1 Tax=Botrimarina colliarenosi TaxID=2528001 RepID=A0A5C6AFI1_9BACT|nr:alpha-E domain-containing protein [Botrimarina colliarenosi]TWT98190.1 hypothetical protein Pla108_23470 [Botrimarina colliarenosi]
MLSRVAESVFWMSRYVERAENVARFIDVNDNLTLGEGVDLSEQWAPLVYTTGDQELFTKLYGEPQRESVLRFLAFDPRNPNSIFSCIAAARENARSVRESITVPMWEQINKYYLLVQSSLQNARFVAEPSPFCDLVKHASHTLVGTTDATMSHNEAWHFSRIGRLLERADKTSRILDVQYFHLLPNVQDVGSTLDVVRWSALLKSASALTMYRRVHGRITPDRVAEFLLLDRDFPRSMRFCVMRAQDSINEITGSRPGTFSCRSEQQAGRLRSEMDYTAVDDVVQQGMHEYIDGFQDRLNEIGAALQKDFFTLDTDAETQHQTQSQRMLR